MAQRQFTGKAQEALNTALAEAREMGHTYVGSEHILLGLLSVSDSVAASLLNAGGVKGDSVRDTVVKNVGIGERSSVGAADMTPRTKKIIEMSAQLSARFANSYIGTEHILLAILTEPECYAYRLIASSGASVSELQRDLSSRFASGGEGEGEHGDGKGGKNGESIPSCPTLSEYGRDLCRMAREGKLDPIIGRDAETERVIEILSRRTKNNPCLIGEPGVGKTAVVEGLARRIAEGKLIPETLAGKTVVSLDLSAMIAGAKYRGEFEERMKNVMNEVSKNKNVILFIDEIHNLIGAGGAEGAIDAANILKPALARGEVQMIGATTIDEFRRHIEHDAALERRFQSVTVGEPSEEEAEKILLGLRDKYEAHHKVKITDAAIKAAVTLSARYINDRYLPDKAIDLIDEASAKARIARLTPSDSHRRLSEELASVTAEKEEAIVGEDFEAAARLRDRERELREAIEREKNVCADSGDISIGEDEIADTVTAWTKIPVRKLCEEEGTRLLNLDRILKERVIGQDEACDAVARAIRRGRVGLKSPDRPIGSFIFLGPTGVGKTELSKVLADVMFASPDAMIRVDMSEYMEKHSTSKLIGSPPGYVGYDDGGQLTEKVRRRPYSVILFDEIEKAHPDVFNILLQILDDGRLTDAQGRVVNFKNTVIIMTSNVGAGSITEPKRLGFAASADGDSEAMKSAVTDALKATFRPEFLNRIDSITVFNKLTKPDIERITELMLADVARRAADIGITLTFSPELVAQLAEAGFDPIYGARPLRRKIVTSVEDSLSEAMLRGDIAAGDKVNATVKEDNGVTFSIEKVAKETLPEAE